MTNVVDTNLAPEALTLATLIHLARRAREARDFAELAFIAVNETHELVPYRQAALWAGKVRALSGVVKPEANAPYVQWLERVIRQLEHFPQAHIVMADDLAVAERDEWGEWLPAHGLWLPLPNLGRFSGGGLLIARDDPWSEAELGFLAEWAAIWAHAAAGKNPTFWGRLSGTRRPRRIWGGLLLSALVIAGLTVPVPLSVLAPGEIVPLNPAVIRAPLDGVIEQLLVTPNQMVTPQQPLSRFDQVSIENRLQVARLALAAVQAEYRQKAQQAFTDSVSKAQLVALQGQLSEKETELEYLRTLHQRGVVTSPQKGVVVLDDPNGWAGRPVVTGERIMMVADPQSVEVEAWLAPGDALSFAPQAPVQFFLNADPLQPLSATLRYIAYEAQLRPDGHYAYRVRATLPPGVTARIGLKGTAKLFAGEVSLGYWIFRRPLAGIRAALGM